MDWFIFERKVKTVAMAFVIKIRTGSGTFLHPVEDDSLAETVLVAALRLGFFFFLFFFPLFFVKNAM